MPHQPNISYLTHEVFPSSHCKDRTVVSLIFTKGDGLNFTTGTYSTQKAESLFILRRHIGFCLT